MNCGSAQKMLHRYREGELTDRQRRRLDRHVAGCDRCRAVAVRLEAVEGATKGLRDTVPVEPDPTALTDAIMARVAVDQRRADTRRPGRARSPIASGPGRPALRPALTVALALLVLALGVQEVSLMRRIDRLERRMAESGSALASTDPSSDRLEASGAVRVDLPGGSGLAGEMLDSAAEADLVLVRRSDLERLIAGIYPNADPVSLEALLVRHFPELGDINLADGISRHEARRLLAYRTEILDVLRGL